MSELRLRVVAFEANRVTCGHCRFKRNTDGIVYCQITRSVLRKKAGAFMRAEECLTSERATSKGTPCP